MVRKSPRDEPRLQPSHFGIGRHQDGPKEIWRSHPAPAQIYATRPAPRARLLQAGDGGAKPPPDGRRRAGSENLPNALERLQFRPLSLPKPIRLPGQARRTGPDRAVACGPRAVAARSENSSRPATKHLPASFGGLGRRPSGRGAASDRAARPVEPRRFPHGGGRGRASRPSPAVSRSRRALPSRAQGQSRLRRYVVRLGRRLLSRARLPERSRLHPTCLAGGTKGYRLRLPAGRHLRPPRPDRPGSEPLPPSHCR